MTTSVKIMVPGRMKLRIAALALIPGLLSATTASTSKSKKAASSKSSSTKLAHSRKGRYVAARRKIGPTYQTHPTAERYKQIQQALADKGYFKGTVDGNWGDDSVNALKQFQSDKHLENDGKINSLSLIQLGLGPKHDGGAVSAVSPALPPPPPPVTEAQPEASQSAQ
jgi:peptidoglycan hydrolase-like protein with peptidoglycan-binding domain